MMKPLKVACHDEAAESPAAHTALRAVACSDAEAAVRVTGGGAWRLCACPCMRQLRVARLSLLDDDSDPGAAVAGPIGLC